MTGLIIPGSDASQASIDLIKDQTDTIPRLISGTIEILEDSGTTIPVSLERIQSGTIAILESVPVASSASVERIQSGIIEILDDMMSSLPSLIETPRVSLTAYGREVVSSGIQLNGSAWVDVFTINPVTSPTLLTSVQFTTSGNLVGSPKYRMTDELDNKIFPHVDENTLVSGSEDIFNHTIDVPVIHGYKIQARTTSVDDSSGKTVSMDTLSKIELSR